MRINYKQALVTASAAVVILVACGKDDEKPAIKNTGVMITDLAADTAAATGAGAKAPRYFTFATKLISAADTGKWDISFTGTYNGDVTAKNGKIAFVDSSFDALTTVPNDTAFKYSAFGINAFMGSVGWYNYDMTTHILTALPNRTMVFKNNTGQYVKLQMISLYKGNPVAPTRQTPAPYLTFQYFVQTNGSKNLATVK
ncbi:HmuY family protein [Chitinophaga sedimenti]|uniref:HmuY family protein n=1 Tax=Chitinophaga sedimenti TaxID=2033606 RepID=UPI0020061B61|nr:HmuY family protein [Chitinophaga sedimenti]MCK7558968.1 HmuY family protein [Chitinophaga sedimenti]